ncbi:MAG TPA: NAD/NADP octopine/nopaline dehydrogenase family protein [Burkholderiales bacterium]|nr:NAD/NADP octopine/nopaline dehydrogenase family protein [Burkholderiales bacterium]
MKKITIIGCGHGGMALSGYFALQGHEVTIYAHHNHPGTIKEVAQQNMVKLTGNINGVGLIKATTSQMNIAIKGAQFIFIALPVIAHETIFNLMLPFLENGQTIINLAGHFSGIFQNEILKKLKIKKDIYIADTTSFPYACRTLESYTSNIVAVKQMVGIASTNKNKTNYVFEQLKTIFPTKLELKKSLIEVGFYDPSGISHVPNTIFNAGRIGNGQEFYFYKEGITQETSALLEYMDYERVEVGKYLGLTLLPYHQVMNEYYNLNHISIFDFFKNSPIHNANKFCPNSLDSRYLTEDVPYSLVPWYSAGVSMGYTSHTTKSIIDIASKLHKTDYFKYGRQLTNQNIEDYHLCG